MRSGFALPWEILPSITGKLSGRQLQLARVWRKWDSIVGEPVCRHAWPSHFSSKDTLVILVSDSVWMQQLSFNRELLRSRIQEIMGTEYKIAAIRLKVGDVEGARTQCLGHESRGEDRWRLPDPDPRDLDEIDALFARAGDQELTSAMRRLFLKSAALRRDTEHS